jgi:hypothetical protein
MNRFNWTTKRLCSQAATRFASRAYVLKRRCASLLSASTLLVTVGSFRAEGQNRELTPQLARAESEGSSIRVGWNDLADTVSTPQEAIQDLIAQIDEIVANGGLDAGLATSLRAKLPMALAFLREDFRVMGTSGMITAFVDETTALLKAGFLDQGTGQSLLSSANHVLQETVSSIGPQSGSRDKFWFQFVNGVMNELIRLVVKETVSLTPEQCSELEWPAVLNGPYVMIGVYDLGKCLR